ncbi:MAG TPA: helix-turn-helix domain-containing protein [Chitinophagaceae bacterium]|jgi:AraC-like DNA-binding protein|nr:helix-turn-helix domain-containing protein [Chitinophagaceae bacterium]
MFFKRIEPDPVLKHIIECYWIVEDENSTPKQQKIIPDGFTEIIFHFGDPYRIKLSKQWELQSKSLVAGQITKHFLLENTGTSSVLGIKLRPASLTHLYNLDMHLLTDYVPDIRSILQQQLSPIEMAIRQLDDHPEKINKIEEYFKNLPALKSWKITSADKAIDLIFEKKGMVTVAELCSSSGIGERQLENLFKKYVGLSPKFFSRIIRFNYIFELVQENKQTWSALAYEAAYYDQSHFIRNFKKFTGESPSSYSFDEQNMANFFLNKK